MTTREIILEALAQGGPQLKPSAVHAWAEAELGGCPVAPVTIRQNMTEMADQGDLVRVRYGVYARPENVAGPPDRQNGHEPDAGGDATRLPVYDVTTPAWEVVDTYVLDARTADELAGGAPLIAVRMPSEVMAPTLRAGEVVIVRRTDQVSASGIYLYRLGDDTAVDVRQFERRPGGLLRATARHEAYAAFEAGPEDLGVLGRIVAAMRRF